MPMTMLIQKTTITDKRVTGNGTAYNCDNNKICLPFRARETKINSLDYWNQLETIPRFHMSVLRLEIGGNIEQVTTDVKKLTIRSYNSKPSARALDVGPFTVAT